MNSPPKKRTISKQRRFPRFQLSLQAVVVGRANNDEESFIFVTENISIGGLLVRSDRAYPNLCSGMQLELWIYLKYPQFSDSDQDLRIQVRAEVMHLQGLNSFGMQFLAISPEDRRSLDVFLEHVSRLEPHRVVKIEN